MSTDVSNVRVNIEYDDITSSKVTENNFSETKDVGTMLLTGENVNNDSEKNKRIDDIIKIVKNSPLNLENAADVIDFLDMIGYSSEKLSSMADSEFEKVKKLLTTITKFIVDTSLAKNKRINDSAQALKKCGVEINKMLQNGNSIDEVINFHENYKNFGLFEILKTKFPQELKQYKSIKDIPENVLINCLKNLINLHKEHAGKNDKQDIGSQLQVFLGFLGRTNFEDKMALLKAFNEIAKNDNDVKKGMMAAIQSLSREELEQFINCDGIKEIVEKLGLPQETITTVVLFLYDQMQTNGLDKALVTEKLRELVQPAISRYQSIMSKPENERTQEEIEFINNWNTLGQIYPKILEILSVKDSERVNEYTDWAGRIGISKEDFYKNIIKFANEKNLELDTQTLDEQTEGNFSNVIKQMNEEVANQSPSDSSHTGGIGFSQNGNSINGLPEIVKNKTKELYKNIPIEDEFVVINNEAAAYVTNPGENYRSMVGLTAEQITIGIKNKYIKIGDVLENYKTLSESGKYFVDKLIEIKTPKELNFCFKSIKESVVMTIIKRTNINPDELEICLTYANRTEAERIAERRNPEKEVCRD